MTFLSMQIRSADTTDPPSVEALHVRRKQVDYTREGFPDTAQGVCSCGWAGTSHEAQRSPIGHDPVDRDLHAHIVAMREAAK